MTDADCMMTAVIMQYQFSHRVTCTVTCVAMEMERNVLKLHGVTLCK